MLRVSFIVAAFKKYPGITIQDNRAIMSCPPDPNGRHIGDQRFYARLCSNNKKQAIILGKLIAELKRRKVFRVAAVYAVVSWVLIQVADTVLPALQMPDWTVSFVTVLFMLGFPIAVILAWAFEATPDGIRADASAPTIQSIGQTSDQKLIYSILVLVIALGAFQVADRFLFNSQPSQNTGVAASSNAQVRRSILPLGLMNYSEGGVHASRTTLSLSPDGSRLAYTAHSDGKIQLYIRELDQLESRPLGIPFDNREPTSLAFSPDGEALAYYDGQDLKKVSVSGGGTQTIAAGLASSFFAKLRGLDWAEDNTIVLEDSGGRLLRISATSGAGQTIDIPPLGSLSEFHAQPDVLPGGDAMLFTTRMGGPWGGNLSGCWIPTQQKPEYSLKMRKVQITCLPAILPLCGTVRSGQFLLT
jgi:hypothetical protein